MDLAYKNDLMTNGATRARHRRMLTDACLWFADGSVLDRLERGEEVPAKTVLAEIPKLRTIEKHHVRHDEHDTVSVDSIDAFEIFVKDLVGREAAHEKLTKAVKAAAKAGLTYGGMQRTVVRIMDEMLRADPTSIPEETDKGWGF